MAFIVPSGFAGLSPDGKPESYAQYEARMALSTLPVDSLAMTMRRVGPMPLVGLAVAGIAGAALLKSNWRFLAGLAGLGAGVGAYFVGLDRRNLKNSYPDAPW